MKRRVLGLAVVGVLAAAICPATVSAQFPSETVGFNGSFGDPANDQEMFRTPQTSGTTDGYIIPNTSGFDFNAAYREAGFITSPPASLFVFYSWVETFSPDAWLRLTTFGGSERPNPSCDVEGKIRFNLTNGSESIHAPIGVCIGIRETGLDVPQLSDGGTGGDIEWVGVDTSSVTAITPGEDGVNDSTVGGDDVVIEQDDGEGGTEVVGISWGANGMFESTVGGDDEELRGAFIGTNGIRGPIPVVELPVFPLAKSLEFDLATGNVRLDGVNQGGGIVGFTGDGDLTTPNQRGTFEHVAFTNVSSDDKTLVNLGIDDLQFEATIADPVPPPVVRAPIIAGDEQVTVTSLLYEVDEVTLYVNGGLIETIPASLGEDAVFDLASPAVEGDIYTATQASDQSGSLVTSDQSQPVTVLPEPPPMSVSILLDEGGTGSCTFASPGWEWIGVTSVLSSGGFWAPAGINSLFNSEGVWQTIDIPLDDDDIIIAGLGGDGALEPSPAEDNAYTIDTLWFTLAEDADSNGFGPWEVYIDAIQVLDEFGDPFDTVLDNEDDVNRFQFARGQSQAQPSSSAISTTTAFDGLRSHRVEWTYESAEPTQALGMLQRLGFTCGTSQRIPDVSSAIRFHLHLRRVPDGAVPLPSVSSPIIAGTQDSIRVFNDASATSVQLFVNGSPSGAPVAPTGTETDFTGLTLVAGDSISALQVIGGEDSPLAYPAVVSDVVLPPILPVPILPGVSSVTVNGLVFVPFAEAEVEVFVNGASWGTGAATGESTEISGAPPLVGNDVVTAIQTVNGVVSDESDPVTVQFEAPILYKAPAEGETTVRVLRVFGSAIASVVLRDDGGAEVNTFTGAPEPGDDFVDVPVSGLVAGYTVTAFQSVGPDDSPESAPETVTVGTMDTVFFDDMESYVDQDDFENQTDPLEQRDRGWWPSSGDPGLTLVDDRNATPGGAQSAYAPAGQSPPAAGWTDGWQSNYDFQYRLTPLDPVSSTATEPLVWSVAIYDTQGPGVDNMRQWAELRDYSTGGLGGLIAIGMPGSSFFTEVDNDYYQARVLFGVGPNYINLDELDAPTRTVGWHIFTAAIKPDSIDFYIDGNLARKAVPRPDIVYDNLYMGSGYEPAFEGWYDDFLVYNGKVAFADLAPQAPGPPTVNSPVEAGDTTVSISGVDSSAFEVTVFANGSPIGNVDPAGADTVDVPVTALVHLDEITATQTNLTAESDPSNALEVGQGVGDILVCIGIREEGGSIEWIGATAALSGAPQGTAISPDPGWQTLTFDPLTDPILGFTGDGVIDGTTGTLEHLAVAVNASSMDRSTGVFNLYVDNVVNVGAGEGGADVVIADFDAFEDGDEVLFQEPTFSGSTFPADLAPLPSVSATTSAFGNPDKSQWLRWFWKDTTEQRWARITTSSTQFLATPEIDLTSPIRLEVLLTNDVPPPPGGNLIEAYSVGVHAAVGGYPGGDVELPIDLTTGLVEPRLQAADEMSIRLVFDAAVSPSDFTVGVSPDPGLTPSLAAGASADELVLTFDDVFPVDRYEITLSAAVGGGTFPICYSQGDVNCSGDTTGTDLARIQSPANFNKDLSEAGTDPRADVNRSGNITGTDLARTQAPAFWNQPVPPLTCECP